MKKILKVLLLIVFTFSFIKVDKVNAITVQPIDYHGLYCGYQDNEGNFYTLVLNAFYKESQISLETDDFSSVLGMYTDKSMSNSEVVNAFVDKQIYVKGDNGNYYWNCPTDSSKLGISGLTLKEQGCYNGNCDTSITPSINESYSCTYSGQRTGGKLTFNYVLDETYNNGKWEITYPDNVTKTFIGTEINGNLMPSKECEDIYYVADNHRINVAIYTNDSISTNATLSGLCQTYKENQIEHFCSGTCSYKEMSCPNNSGTNSSGCPKSLIPIFRFIKKILTPVIQIGIPILLILMGSIDMARAVAATDDKMIKEAASRFLRRCIAALAVFFIVTIVTVLMNMFAKTDIGAQNDWKACWTNLDD